MPNQYPPSVLPQSYASQSFTLEALSVPVASAAGVAAIVDAAAAFVPVAWLDWDGDWPALAAALPVRGVVQQLAQQSELRKAEQEGDGALLHLVVAIDTLRSAVTVDKLAVALTERFCRPVRIETTIGPVRYTANSRLAADRAERQRQAEQTMQSDPFVQTMLREFGATIVPGSVKPISTI